MNDATILLTAKIMGMLVETPIRFNSFALDLALKTNSTDKKKSYANCVYKVFQKAIEIDMKHTTDYEKGFLLYASKVLNLETFEEDLRLNIANLSKKFL